MNKNASASNDLVASLGSVKDLTLPASELLFKVQIIEKLAFKMLSPDNLQNFMTIKTSLVEITILMMNLGWREAQEEMLKILTQGIFVEKLENSVLQKGTERLEEIVFLPYLTIPDKIEFQLYFEGVRENEEIHEAMFEAMSGKMLLKDQILHYKPMIASCVERQIAGKPSPLTEDDVEILKSFVILVLEGDDIASMPFATLSAYFTSSKGLLE